MTARGRWLLAARVAWVVAAALTLLVMVASVPILFEKFSTVCEAAASDCLERSEVPVGMVEPLRAAGVSLGAYAAFTVGVEVFCKLVWISVAALVFVLRSHDRMALLVSFFLLTFGTATLLTNGTEALAATHPAWWVVARSLQIMGEVFIVMFLLTFPDGRFVPRWTPIVAVVFLVFQVPGDLFPGLISESGFMGAAQLVVFVGTVFTMVGSQVYRYRYVSAVGQRRQTRWVVFGITFAITALILIFATIFFLLPGDAEGSSVVALLVGSGIPLFMLIIPASVGVAVLRSGLFDIDVFINRALVYGTLTATLIFTYLAIVVSMQYVFRTLVGEESQLVIVASTLAIAALFQPFRRRIQNFIDRRFYREKYDAARTLEAFAARLRSETDLETLSGDLVSVARETVRPAHASLWLKPSGGSRRHEGSRS